MASDKPRFLVTRTYDVVAPESARDGEASERGYVYEGEPMSLEGAVRELRECVELSTDPVRSPRDLTGGEWASTEPQRDHRDGSELTNHVHVETLEGEQLPPRVLYRLFRLAGHVA
jgi:hypothetical protein